MHSLGGLTLQELLGASGTGRQAPGRWQSLLAGRLLPLLTGPQARRRTARAVTRWLRARREAGATLADLIPEEAPRPAGRPPALLPAAPDCGPVPLAAEEETRRQLEERGKRLLRGVLDRLNLLQKIIVSAGAFERTLEQRMPEILGDVLDELEAGGGGGGEPPADGRGGGGRRLPLAGAGARGGARGERRGALDGRWRRCWPSSTGRRCGERIGSALARAVQGPGGRPLGEILARTFGVGEREMADFAANHLLRLLAKPETAPALARGLTGFARRFLEEDPDGRNGGPTLGELLALDAPRLASLSGLATNWVIRILDRHLPELIHSFDFRGLVVRKIDELNVAEVERLLMMVIARHLKWINLFGALLGALIGFAQLGLRFLP